VASGLVDRLSLVELSRQTGDSPPADVYPYANAAVLYLVEHFGAAKVLDFYGRYRGALRTRARGDPTNDALRKVYGLDEHKLDTRTREYIRAH